MSRGNFGGEIFQQDIGSKTRVFGMPGSKAPTNLAGIEPQCALLAERCDFYRWPHAHGFTVGMFAGCS